MVAGALKKKSGDNPQAGPKHELGAQLLLGQGGPDAGDIIAWHAEGYNFDHADCISTTLGENDTSVSPIFIAAGKGLKEGFRTDRIIRQIDFAATVAVLGGVRMPAQCEGAPVYQILADEY